jgi:hypothetical protein
VSLARSAFAFLFAWAGIVAAACGEPTGLDGLEAVFRAVPDSVEPGGAVQVAFTLRNTTGTERVIRSSSGCLFFLRTLRGDEPVSWDGSGYGCAAAITDFRIAPRDSLHWLHTIFARPSNTADTLPAGTYRIRTRMNADLPDMEAVVVVVAGGSAASRVRP